MPTYKAQGYANAATSAQANQIVYNRGIWEPDQAYADADLILIGKLPAGHRIIPRLVELYVNDETEAMNVDVCVGIVGNVLIDGTAVTAATATYATIAATAVPHTVAETIGVDYDNDRDVFLLLNTAPTGPGGKVVVNYASFAASRGS